MNHNIKLVTTAVLHDLKDFIPNGYFSCVKTDDDFLLRCWMIAKEIRGSHWVKPKLTARQLAAVNLLHDIGLFGENEGKDIVLSSLDSYRQHLTPEEAKPLSQPKPKELEDLRLSNAELLELEKEIKQQPQETKPKATEEDKHDDEELAKLFDLVTVAALENMFKSNKWKSWANHASSNGLKESARVERGKYNPYKAAIWFLGKNVKGWDLARVRRVLANNLPDRSMDKKYLLVDEFD